MTVALEARIVADVERVTEVPVDPDSQRWLRDLRSAGSEREAAVARLHGLLVRAARFEVARLESSLSPPATQPRCRQYR